MVTEQKYTTFEQEWLDYFGRDSMSMGRTLDDATLLKLRVAHDKRLRESKESLRDGFSVATEDRPSGVLAEPVKVPEQVAARIAGGRVGSRVGKCPENWLHGSTSAGERFAKELYCGSEWCPVCGKKGSVSHNRRFEAWLPKAQQCKQLGLMVIEFPLSSRNKPRSKKALGEYGKLAVEVLTGSYEAKSRRRNGETLLHGEVAEIKARHFSRGMRRWHYFGDVKKELGKLNLDGFTTFEPEPDILASKVKSNCHLNVLLDAGYLPKPWFEHIVFTLRIAFNEPRLIVHYGYVKEPGRIVHLLKYTTRSTFLDYKWDEYLAGQLYGFRNMRSWGKWLDEPVWSLPEAGIKGKEAENMLKRRELGKGVSYKTGLLITWSKPRPIVELKETIAKGGCVDLGSGYWELPSVEPPKSHIDESEGIAEQRRLLVKAKEVVEAKERASLRGVPRDILETEADYKARIERMLDDCRASLWPE